jgi:leucyl aminopeptidase
MDGVVGVMSSSTRDWIAHAGFEPKPGAMLLLPGAAGRVQGVLFGLGQDDHHERTVFLPGRLAALLPPGTFRFGNEPDNATLATLAFALQAYSFRRYRSAVEHRAGAQLVVPESVDNTEVRRIADAVAFGRDLINAPANDLGPEELAHAAVELATAHGATTEIIVGDDLLASGFPLVHAVGKGSMRAPRLADMRWGDQALPKVTIVGKGVVFDTGGLDLKSPSNMLIMKKDMGGAACALTLARLIMESALPVRLRVLLPIVENAVSGSSFRPLDVIKSRKGVTVEIGDTDAEGRLILADALACADEEAPDILIDLATLTGAARVALGSDIPPFYTPSNALATAISTVSERTFDPVWRLPLWRPYLSMLDSKVADTSNITGTSFAGSMTAALFLSKFVQAAKSWVHFDVYGWSASAKPGKPEGGEVQAVRALYQLLRERYAT